jgi:DNA helicase-2/ATP-dependent DNA helicase PcrA
METSAGNPGDMVNLMTLHSAKGLEFDTVFLPGWEEGLFPHQRALDETGIAGLEEERRLAYVGITRARRLVYVSYAANRRVHNLWQSALPSRFVDELPAAHVERDIEVGLDSGSRRQAGFSDWGSAPRRSRLAEGGASFHARARPSEFDFDVGQRVFHMKFGYGSVTATEGDKLHIDFDKAGAKKVMASFLVPAEKAG